ncbi:MAG: hypothetical protein PHP98_03995 [Kiritimatiellae bacterium]|nr:hypothetical protein [Kiritimatiellia bacterium]
MKSLKIACLGGGSLYFLRVLGDLAWRKDLSGSEIVLYDLDEEKAVRMAKKGQDYVRPAGATLTIRAVSSLGKALDSADFVVTSIGGSGAEITTEVYCSTYHEADISIPRKYGINQIVGDTCGPAGMMMAFRSIPAYLVICREMEKRCPRAILINHSNPMAVLCRAMRKYTRITIIGLCHGVQAGIGHAAKILGIPARELECVWIGTNHYYWFTQIRHNGKDVYPELMKRIAVQPPEKGGVLSAQLSGIYGYQIVYPEDDHVIEFYPFLAHVPRGRDDLPEGLAESDRKFNGEAGAIRDVEASATNVRAEFMKKYQAALDKIPLPKQSSDSIAGEGLAGMISAIAHGRREVCIANIANQGAVSNLPFSAEIETEAVTDSYGVRPIHVGEAPLVLKGILEKRFVWQELVADAAVKGDRQIALQALMSDEMAIWPDKAGKMLDELLKASRDLLPQFYKGVKRSS